MGQYHPARRDSATSSILFGAYDDNEEAVGLTQLNETEEEAQSDGDAFHAAKYRHSKPSHLQSPNDSYSGPAAIDMPLDNDTIPDSASHFRR